MRGGTQHLKVGDTVQVCSKAEILATLDADGRLEGLPFMPQMFQHCGRRFKVVARAHKTCDVVSGEGRRLKDGIHLDIRCDGQAYGGCQAACLIFWKLAWLERVPIEGGSEDTQAAAHPRHTGPLRAAACVEEDVWRATNSVDETSETVHFCQATRVPYFTTALAWWDPRQYIEDYRAGNVTLGSLARGFLFQIYNHGTQAWRYRFGRPARWLYDALQAPVRGIPFPRKPGRLRPGEAAPVQNLNLQPGELVRVKSHEAILETITEGGMNRGLLFDKEMVPFCGRVFRVKTRVHTFVNERTGKLATLKTPAIILEGVWCQSRYSDKKMFCPRSLYSWWREAWLERVDE